MSGAPIKHILTAATTAFLLLTPFAGSAGLRGAALLFAAVALGLRLREHLARLASQFPRAVLFAFAAWAALAVASTAWSRDRAYTLGELKPEVLYAATALLFFFLAANAARWRLWWAALMAGTVLAFLGGHLQDVLPFALSRHSVDGGPGHFSTHLALVTPLVFAIIWPAPWGRDKGPLLLVAALAFVVIAGWFTQNRMLWPALAAELLVGIAAWRASPREGTVSSASLRRVTLVVGVVLVAAFATSVIERSDKALRLSSPAAMQVERDLRPRIWGVAAERFREAPWLGHGFGREVLAEYFIPVTSRAMDHPELRHAHNVFIDVALQLGVAGLLAFLVMLATLAREYRGFLRDARIAPLGMMGLALLAGFVVKNLTDDFFYRHNALVFWAINGALLGLARLPREAP